MFDFAKSREHMVESQIRTSDVTEPKLVRALRTVPRELFLPKSKTALAYADTHVELFEGRYLLSPREFSKLVQAAEVAPTDVVLDIACGRGYSTAVLSRLAETVIGLEEDPVQVEKAAAALSSIEADNAVVLDGSLKAGAPDHGPFDVIFVNGTIDVIPDAWRDSLAQGGRLAAFVVKNGVGRGCIYKKSGSAIGETIVFDAQVPVLPGFERKPAFAL